jgi:maleate isomerase
MIRLAIVVDIATQGGVVRASGAKPRIKENDVSLAYASRGLVGMLTPQANTTVEPEFNLLWPPGVAMINARLVSEKSAMADRLRDYFANYAASLRQFADAPLAVAAAACTGASYLAGREREAALVDEIHARNGYPFITAATAVVDALTVLRARRLGLVSPYPADLSRASAAYWQSHGFDVAEVVDVSSGETAFHPIYSLGALSAARALDALEHKPLDAIVMLGTGMPTLATIANAIGWKGAPVMSCNLCLAWRIVEALDRREPSASTLQSWLAGEGWVDDRLAQVARD